MVDNFSIDKTQKRILLYFVEALGKELHMDKLFGKLIYGQWGLLFWSLHRTKKLMTS